MGAFFVYILKATVCLSVFYLFYRLLLSRETFHRFNRIAVLGILVISLLIPFCEIKVTEQTEVHQTVLSLEQLLLLADMMEDTPAMEVPAEKTVWVHIILLIYLAGILFFICRNIYSLARLCLLLKSGKREKLDDKVSLIVHEQNDLSPFSWMKFVVISRKDLEENGREILIHELAHIHKRHSIDLLIADICIFFQWFNPASWLLKQELQNIHEYEADETVIREGVNAKEYQLLLIKKAVGTRLYSMANSFNHSKLKKRITMMLKEKSSPWARLKYLYVLPLAAIAVSAFARPEISNELNEISKVKVNDLAVIAEVNDAESVSQKNDSVMLIHGTSVVQYKEDGSLSHIEVLDDAEPSYTIVPSAQADEAKKDDQDKTTTLQLTGIKEGKEPLLIVDDKEVSYSILSAIDPSNIESIEVLKNEKATRKYGERGKNGVVVVTLKSVENRAIPKDVPQTGVFISDAKAHSRGNPIIILDGKEVGSIDSVDPSTIKSISVIKNISGASEDDVKLFEQYGEKAKDGIILITSKKSDDTSGVQLLSVQRRSKTIAVDGLVIDESGKPVAGAVVRIVGSQVGTVSDMEGKFSLEAQEIDYITVMFIGMKETVTKVSPKITVTLEKGD